MYSAEFECDQPAFQGCNLLKDVVRVVDRIVSFFVEVPAATGQCFDQRVTWKFYNMAPHGEN